MQLILGERQFFSQNKTVCKTGKIETLTNSANSLQFLTVFNLCFVFSIQVKIAFQVANFVKYAVICFC